MRFCIAIALLVMVVFCGGMPSQASKTDLVTIAAKAQKKDPTIVINQNTAEVIDVAGPVADIMVANPAIASVTVLQSNRLYIVGLSLGSTNLIALDDQGNILKRMNIHVTVDVENVQRMINDLFPDEEVKVEALRGQFILSGTVSTPDVAANVQNLMMHYIAEIEDARRTGNEAVVNLMKVRGKSQVMLKVKILEVSRTLLKQRGADTEIEDLGLDFGNNVENNDRILDIFGDVILGGTFTTGVSEDPSAVFGLMESFGAFGPIDTLISLLEREGLAKILAEPNLTTVSGQQASFLAGGEIPVPTGRDSEGNIVITFRQFGVSLSFTPVVMSEDRIAMQLATEVSSIARESQVTLVDLEVPGLDVRRASTTVEMGSGTTLMIAGLLQSETVSNLSGLPGATRMPVISQLMSSENFRRDETEMVVLVTPYLVEPYADRQQAKNVPASHKDDYNELASAFAQNIRRTYGDLNISALFEGEQIYGYIID